MSAKLYKTAKDLETKEWDVIVIGSGMGGLTTAAALSRRGYKCLVIEQHYVPGGFTHTFTRKGFEWDVGVHAVGDADPRSQVGGMFDYISEGRLKWEYFGDVYETFRFPDDKKYVFPSKKGAFRKAIENYFPEEKTAIQKYFKLVDSVMKQMPLYYAMKTMPAPIMRMGNALGLGARKWRKITTQEVMDNLGMSEACRALLLAQWGYYGEIPRDSSFAIQALIVKHFERGAYFPIGGAAAIAREVIETIRKAGGDVVVRSPVEELVFEGKRVVGVRASHAADRSARYEFRAKYIFSATSALTLVNKLLPPELQKSEWAKEISSFHQSPPHVCLYLGFQGDVEKAGATKSSQWVFKTLDMNKKYWDFKNPQEPVHVMFCSFPSTKDPKHVAGPEMRHTGEVVTFVDYAEFSKWQDSRRGFRPEDYQKIKADIEARLLAEFKLAFPELGKLIVHHELSTPLSTEFFDRSPQGAIYGLEHTPKRFLSNALRTRTPIPGLYLSASDVSTGGVAGGLSGGFLAAATLEPRLFKEMI